MPVRIGGWDGYVVRAWTRGARVECTTPCTLHLQPGPAEIEVVDYFKYTIKVPNRPATADISFRRKGFLVAGAIVGVGGIVTMVYGYDKKKEYEECMDRKTPYAMPSGQTYMMTSCSMDDTGDEIMVMGGLLTLLGVGLSIPGFVTRDAVWVNDEAPSARLRPTRLAWGYTARRDGGGMLTARFAF